MTGRKLRVKWEREKPRRSPQTLCSGKFPRGDEKIRGVSCGESWRAQWRRVQYLCLRKKRAAHVAAAESSKLGNNRLWFVFLKSLRDTTTKWNVWSWIRGKNSCYKGQCWDRWQNLHMDWMLNNRIVSMLNVQNLITHCGYEKNVLSLQRVKGHNLCSFSKGSEKRED